MMHPYSRLKYINDQIGFGVFATQNIPKGTITYIQDNLDIVISSLQYESLTVQQKQQVDWYSYRDFENNRILSWDIARYVNHCCHSNTLSTGWGFEIAVRDIEEGEEITDDYGLFMGKEESLILNCNKENCRGIVHGNSWEQNGEYWDSNIIDSIKHIFEVDQPLMEFLSGDVYLEISNYLNGVGCYKSCRLQLV